MFCYCVFFFQAEDGIRAYDVTGVQTCALPILVSSAALRSPRHCVTFLCLRDTRIAVVRPSNIMRVFVTLWYLRPFLAHFFPAASWRGVGCLRIGHADDRYRWCDRSINLIWPPDGQTHGRPVSPIGTGRIVAFLLPVGQLASDRKRCCHRDNPHDPQGTA